MKNLSKMRTMERHYYLQSNFKKCNTCNKEKKLTSFYIDNELNKNCKICNKKIKRKEAELEVLKLVMGIMKNRGEV